MAVILVECREPTWISDRKEWQSWCVRNFGMSPEEIAGTPTPPEFPVLAMAIRTGTGGDVPVILRAARFDSLALERGRTAAGDDALDGNTLSMTGAVEYRKKPTATVRARELFRPFFVETREGMMCGRPGSFLVEGTRGERYPVEREIFLDIYEEVNGDD